MRILYVMASVLSFLVLASCSSDVGPETEPKLPSLVRGTEDWDWQQIPYSEEHYGIAGGEFGWVICGEKSLTKYSGDGRTWRTSTYGGSEDFYAATFLDDMYIVVGEGPHGKISGYNFSGNYITNQQDTLRSIVWSGTIAVAVGDDGTHVTTHDGRTWTSHQSISDKDLLTVIWGDGKFYCGGREGVFYSSEDGIEWTVEETPIESSITCLSLTDCGFFATTDAGGIWRRYEDGWEQEYYESGVAFRSIAGSENIKVAVGDDASLVFASKMGGWNRWTVPVDSDFRSITFHNHFALIGSNRVVMISKDGITWELRPSFPFFDLHAITSNDDCLIATGWHGALRTVDGVEWTQTRFRPYEGLYAATWADNHFVACGRGGVVLTSETGEEWTKRTCPVSCDLWSVHWTGSEILIGGTDGVLLITADYENWEEIEFPSSGGIFGIDQSPTTIAAVTTRGKICTSTNGRDWNLVKETSRLTDLIWTGTHFLALESDCIYRSSTGASWTSHEIPAVSGLRGLATDGTRVYAAGSNGRIVWSADLSRWNIDESGFERGQWPRISHSEFRRAFYYRDHFYVTGDGGFILKSKIESSFPF